MLPSLGASGFRGGFAEAAAGASAVKPLPRRVFTCSFPCAALSFAKPRCREVREEQSL